MVLHLEKVFIKIKPTNYTAETFGSRLLIKISNHETKSKLFFS